MGQGTFSVLGIFRQLAVQIGQVSISRFLISSKFNNFHMVSCPLSEIKCAIPFVRHPCGNAIPTASMGWAGAVGCHGSCPAEFVGFGASPRRPRGGSAIQSKLIRCLEVCWMPNINWLVVWTCLEHLLLFHRLGIIYATDLYFEGLNPPTEEDLQTNML